MKDVVQNKLDAYGCASVEEQLHALKEITQGIALYALSKAGFFVGARFQGGTCLRIVHGLDRFSEELDFALKEADARFRLEPYLEEVKKTMDVYGYDIEISGRDGAEGSVRGRFLKDGSIKKILAFGHRMDTREKIRVKVEVDVDPPEGARFERHYVGFPVDFMLMAHDPPSLLAGKCHALLCRDYAKGRDWYDFLWHVNKGNYVNWEMLGSALEQVGPWKGGGARATKGWLGDALSERIRGIGWEEVKRDVSAFLGPERRAALELWGEDFFLKKTEQWVARL